jgi:amino acid permease
MNPEKVGGHPVSVGSLEDEVTANESELKDPQEDTLHRGLKARQISMIAVRRSPT